MVLVDTSSSDVDVSLPYASNVTGMQFKIKKTATSNKLYILSGGSNIDDLAVLELPAGSLPSVTLISNGEQWFILGILNLWVLKLIKDQGIMICKKSTSAIWFSMQIKLLESSSANLSH